MASSLNIVICLFVAAYFFGKVLFMLPRRIGGSVTSILATISLSVQVSWDKIIISGFVSSPLGVASISDVKHKNLSRKFPTDEEVS